MPDQNGHDQNRFPAQLEVNQLFDLTAGTIGHLTNKDQLRYIVNYTKQRIKFLEQAGQSQALPEKSTSMPVAANTSSNTDSRGARTIEDIADRLGVDRTIAYGLVRFLEVKGILVGAGNAIRTPGAKGKPAKIYTLSDDPSCQVEIDNFINFLNSSF